MRRRRSKSRANCCRDRSRSSSKSNGSKPNSSSKSNSSSPFLFDSVRSSACSNSIVSKVVPPSSFCLRFCSNLSLQTDSVPFLFIFLLGCLSFFFCSFPWSVLCSFLCLVHCSAPCSVLCTVRF